MKTFFALLSLIAFSECFAYRGDFRNQEFWDHHHRDYQNRDFHHQDYNHQDYHHQDYNHQDFHHRDFYQVPPPRHFYPEVPAFNKNGFDPSIEQDIITNTIPQEPCYPKRIPNNFNEDFADLAFGKAKDNKKVGTTVEILAKTDNAIERTTKSYIVGDFVFPDQVSGYRKRHQPSNTQLKVTAGMQRGIESTLPDMENRNSVGMGRCPAGQRRVGVMCIPIGHH